MLVPHVQYVNCTENSWTGIFYCIILALGDACSIEEEEDPCIFNDPNSECDNAVTNKCICSDGYIEEFTVCKSKFRGQDYQNILEYIRNTFPFHQFLDVFGCLTSSVSFRQVLFSYDDILVCFGCEIRKKTLFFIPHSVFKYLNLVGQ